MEGWVGSGRCGQVGDQLGNRGRVSWGSGGGQLLTPGVMYLCPVHVPGERVRSLPAEDVHLLPVVFGEVPQLSQPGNAVKVSSAPGPALLTPAVLITQNAYAATAINSTSFCTSARDAFVILVENALRVATINAVGDFVLFLGKVRRGRGLLLHSCSV